MLDFLYFHTAEICFGLRGPQIALLTDFDISVEIRFHGGADPPFCSFLLEPHYKTVLHLLPDPTICPNRLNTDLGTSSLSERVSLPILSHKGASLHIEHITFL